MTMNVKKVFITIKVLSVGYKSISFVLVSVHLKGCECNDILSGSWITNF